MEHEIYYDAEVQTADELRDKIETVLSTECTTHDSIDDALRSYLALLTEHYGEHITTEDHLSQCAYLLYASALFSQHGAYIRQQLIYCLLQEDDINVLRLSVMFLLWDARENEHTFELLNKESAFPKLIDLIAHPKENEESMHRTLMELLYELCRVQTITNDDLTQVSDDFVGGLFDIIEQVSDDVIDPYHYPVIRVILVLNEQFMVAAYDPTRRSQNSLPLTNKVVKVLSTYGHRYKTFGSNIILLLNREDETSLQLLTLKLMYLLFTTPHTQQYFYTNDLRVLADILVRNLLDLPESESSLRHTYLRVLYPLLENTQLHDPPYYKRDEIRKLLSLLCGEPVDNEDGPTSTTWNHFEAADETTLRLVKRCQTVSWLADAKPVPLVHCESPTEHEPSDRPLEPESPTSPTKPNPPQLPAPRKLRKRDSSKASTLTIGGFLTPQLDGARTSSISMAEIAQHKEKPGVITPSRNPSVKQNQGLMQAIFAKKDKQSKPPPPKARRSGFTNPKPQPEVSVDAFVVTGSPQVLAMQEPISNITQTQNLATSKNSPASTKDVLTPVPSMEIPQPIVELTDQQSKKPPPPAPKARKGWRMRKNKDEIVPEEERPKDPGKFSATMPSTVTNTSNEPPVNPFSPTTKPITEHLSFATTKEKTLDPSEGTAEAEGSSKPQKKSISDAMHQAQEQVLREVEERLEGTHVADRTPPIEYPSRSSSLVPVEKLMPTVLAPPSEAPIRAVPGPMVELEKSPFLSDDDDDGLDNERHAPIPDESKEQVKELRTKESWEEFDE